ncbi:ZN184 protein, partial [Pygoscelis papua]
CPKCNKGFRWCSDLIKHQRTHTGEKPFICSEPSAETHLRNHQRAHTGERPFKCTWRGKGFSDFPALAQHQRTHRGKKPYVCSQCGKCFKQSAHTNRKQ